MSRKELDIQGNFIHIRDVVEHSSVLINIKQVETVSTEEKGVITITTTRGKTYQLPWTKYYEEMFINALMTMGDMVKIYTEGDKPLSVIRVEWNGDGFEEEME